MARSGTRRLESGESRFKSLAGGRYPRMGMRTAILNASLCGALATARPERGIDRSPVATSDSATIYLLGALGRRRCRKRTPGPPPFSSMNSTPAASKARRTAKSLAAVIEVSSSVSSARRIVATLRSDRRARSSALQRRRERAALIWALVSGLAILTRITAYAIIHIILDDVRHKPG